MKKLVSERDIIDLYNAGKRLVEIDKNTIVTPLAKDKIKELGIKIYVKSNSGNFSDNDYCDTAAKSCKFIIGGDHTGYDIKPIVKVYLESKGHRVVDIGTHSKESCDYTDYARYAAVKIAMREADYGLLLDATGIPSAITANKVPGIRAATCYNEFSAKSARQHNNANILVMGVKTLGIEVIKSIIDVWLNSSFEGGRHKRRIDKISALEKEFKDGIPFS